MKREVAEKIMSAMKQVEEALAKLDLAIGDVDDDKQRRPMSRQILHTIHYLHVHVTLPVANEYPDLHPDGFSRTY